MAVIGQAGDDAMFTMGGAAAVSVDMTRAITSLDGIRARAEPGVRVVTAQGSWGDVPLPLVPPTAFSLPNGSGPGIRVERVSADGTTSIGTEQVIDFRATEEDITGAWPRRWSALLTSDRSGSHRLSLALAGRVVVRIDGEVVLAGARETVQFVAGPHYPLQGRVLLEAGQPALLEIDYDVGPSLLEPHQGWAPQLRFGWQQPDSMLDDAVAVAADADVAVVFVTMASGEGMDRDGLALPGDQDDLVVRVAAVNPRTVVVLNTPGAVLMPWVDDVAGVLQVWYPGEQFGAALAAMLFGDEEPGGRLPLTFPRDRAHLPGGDINPEDEVMQLRYDEGAAIGHRSSGVRRFGALFPFGHGLGYAPTTCEVVAADVTDGDVQIDLRVNNLGDRATVHVAQAYLELAGFDDGPALVGVARIPVAAGASTDARILVRQDAFLRYDPKLQQRTLVRGSHVLRIADNAADAGQPIPVCLP